MRPRSSGNDAILSKAMSDMLNNWERTGWEWKDKAREDFEKHYIEEIKLAVNGCMNAMGSLEKLLSRAIRECS